MKLADWARKQGIAYLTAYRWFKDDKLPAKAYQSDSGTIIVEDDALEQSMANASNTTQANDAMSLFLKKTVEFSTNNSSIEDFAAYVLTNFSLKLNTGNDSPRYSKVRPKSEDIQKHFQQFIPKGERPKPNMFVTEPQVLDELISEDEGSVKKSAAQNVAEIKAMTDMLQNESTDYNEICEEFRGELTNIFNKQSFLNNPVKTLGATGVDGIVARVDITPQTYTGSTNCAAHSPSTCEDLSRSLSINADCNYLAISDARISVPGPTGAFKPTERELESATKVFKLADSDAENLPRRRGRKLSRKNAGKNQ